MPKKSPLDVLIAIGKGGPKSRNPDGASDSSISAPDQGGDAMAPGGDMAPEESMDAPDAEMMSPPDEEMPNSLMLPKGFKLPSGVDEGVEFTTTIRGKKMGDHLMVTALGDMPLKGEAGETMADEMAETPEEQTEEAEAGTEMHPEAAKMAMNYKKKKADSDAARKAFQS